VLSSGDDGVLIEIAIPKIYLDSVEIGGEFVFVPKVPWAGFHSNTTNSDFPAKMTLDFALALPSIEGVSIEIIEVEDTTFAGIKLASISCECPISGDCIPPSDDGLPASEWHYSDIMTLGEPFRWRAVNGVGLSFNLYSFNPSGDSLKIHRKVRAKISADGAFGKLVLESWLEQVYLANFPNIAKQEHSISGVAESYQVLYIYADHSNDYYGNLANKLADLRYKQGWRVHLVSAGEIYDVYQPLYPADSETTWIRHFIADTFEFYRDLSGIASLSYVGLIGPDDHDLDSLPAVKIGDGTRPPVTESTYSLPTYMPQLGVGRMWAVRTYGAGGTELLIERILQNETEYLPGGNWMDFMFVSQTSDVIFGYVDAQAQAGAIQDAGFNLTHYTCHDTTMGMLPPGTLRGMNDAIITALEVDKFAAVWHFGHGTHGAWFKSGPACAGSGEGAITSYDLMFRSIGYPTGVVSGGCRTAREIGYEFVGRGALFYYGGILDGAAPHDFVSKIRGYSKIVGDAWRSHLIWSPRLIGDPLTRFYGSVEPTKFFVSTIPECYYYTDEDIAESLYVFIAPDGPARWLHDTRICITSGFISNTAPVCKVVPYAGNQVVFSPEEVRSVAGLDLIGEDTLFITCYKRDFITQTVELPTASTLNIDSTVHYFPRAGWNLISVPLNICGSTLADIFPQARQILTWDNSTETYIDASMSVPDASLGYWLLFTKDNDTVSITGAPVMRWEREINSQWNVVGSVISRGNDIVWGTSHRFVGSGIETTPDFLIRYDAERDCFRPTMLVAEGEGYFYHVQGEGTLSFPETTFTTIKGQAKGASGLFELFRGLPNPPEAQSAGRLAVEIDWRRKLVTIRDAENGRVIDNALVIVFSDDGVRIHYDDAFDDAGTLSLPYIERDRPLRILIKCTRYVDFQVLSSISLTSADSLWGDVEIWGDVVVGRDDTLRISPATEIIFAGEGRLSAMGDASLIAFNGTVNDPIQVRTSAKYRQQSAEFLARDGGAIRIAHTSLEGIGGIEIAGKFAGNLMISSSKFQGDENISITNRARGASLLIEDCVFVVGLELSGWRGKSRIERSSFRGESGITIGEQVEEITIERCEFIGFESHACEVNGQSRAVFRHCGFSGKGTAVINRSSALYPAGIELFACNFDARGGPIIISSEKNTRTTAEFSTFKNFVHACAVSNGILDFGDKAEGLNCIYTGTAEWTFEGESEAISANFCYFDTLIIPENVDIRADNREIECPREARLAKLDDLDCEKCIPDVFRLGMPTPNPFNSNVLVDFDLAVDAHVSIEIYNINGVKIVNLIDSNLRAGTYRAMWNGLDVADYSLPSGIYLCKMAVREESGEPLFEEFRKMTLIK